MKPLRTVAAIIASGFLLPLVISSYGCKKDEPPPPLPSAPPAVSTPAAPQTLELAPEPVPSDSAAEVKKPVGGGSGASLGKCCAALIQNSKSAPPPNNTMMLQAGQVCQAAVAAGQAAPQILNAVRAAMGGGALPAGCQ
ncbi:MAG TPA: hypothetical protein VJN18_33790 [Polyangiaceae bacterium]|nr:hypothetical protein [Polyangiaceae bacterium]